MPKKTSEREAGRERRKELVALLEGAGITDVAGVQELYKEMVGTVLESGLESELEEELGYSRYDYRNKGTDNCRNGHSEKSVRSSFGEIELPVPRNRKGEFEPQMVKSTKPACRGTSKRKSFPCTPRV